MSRRSKLTEAQKRYIRRAFRLRQKLTNRALAKRFGVSRATITICAYPERPLQIKLRRVQGHSRGVHTSGDKP